MRDAIEVFNTYFERLQGWYVDMVQTKDVPSEHPSFQLWMDGIVEAMAVSIIRQFKVELSVTSPTHASHDLCMLRTSTP